MFRLCFALFLLLNVTSHCYGRIHFPGYKFCGGGEITEDEITANVTAINKLDNFCREHDIELKNCKPEDVQAVDDKFINNARQRIWVEDSTIWETISAWIMINCVRAREWYNVLYSWIIA